MTLSDNQYKALKERLSDPYYRLCNLYHIVNKTGKSVLFHPNWAQEELRKNIWYCNIVLKARQLGISTFCCLYFLDKCLFRPNTYAGILSYTQEEAKQLFKKVKYAYDMLPEAIKSQITATVDSANELTLSNGSSLRVGTSMRGSTFQFLHISEFGKICATDPAKEREIIAGSLNTIAPGSVVIIESTAEGKEGAYYDMCKRSQQMQIGQVPLSKLDYRFHFFPWYNDPTYALDTSYRLPSEFEEYFNTLEKKGITLTAEQKQWYYKKAETQYDNMKREYPSTPDEAFETAIEGAYYMRQLSNSRAQGKISDVYYGEDYPVHTAWDLGYGDSTSIWLFQLEGNEIHIFDYIEGSGEPLTYYLRQLANRNYVYGTHLVPHDAMHHEYGSGFTRVEIARKNGFEFTVVPQLSVDEGIDAVRYLFPRFWFDSAKCAKGISHLDNYKRAWNAKQGCWGSRPQHDASSHAADALRTIGCGYDLLRENPITQDYIDRMQQKHNPRFYG